MKQHYVNVLSMVLGVWSGLTACLAPAGQTSRPNILLVLLDDVSAKEFSCYGGRGIDTPMIDRMAREGVMFRTAWSTPLCGPSRVLLHTGRYACRTKYYENNIGPKRPFWNSHRVMGNILKSAGYATAMYGKSHFSNDPSRDLGFDEYAICRYWKGYDGPPQNPDRPGDAGMYAVQWYWHPGLVANGKGIPTKADDFGPEIEARLIADFIHRRRAGSWFVYYPTNLPHMGFHGKNFPSGPGAQWRYTDVPETNADGNRTGKRIPGSLKSNLEYIDGLLARLWKQVCAEGLERRTILIVTGDNGTATYGKGKLQSEVGVHVPLVVYGPGQVKKVGASDSLIDFSDILPTLVELSGASLPQGYALDGRSFAPLLRGEPFEGRPWIHSYLGTARWVRTADWLLDGNGTLWHCGANRDETMGYQDASTMPAEESADAGARFARILNSIPAPDLDDPEIGAALRQFQNKTGSPSRQR